MKGNVEETDYDDPHYIELTKLKKKVFKLESQVELYAG